MSKKEWTNEPCKRCGKTPRYDYAGYCMDCADDMIDRGLLVPLPDQCPNEVQAETAPSDITDKKDS